MNIYKILKPLIFKIESEKAHNLAINYLKNFPNLATIFTNRKNYDNLKQEICGIEFKNPLGMAAGFDKNAFCVKALNQFGFGFVEVGTITPKSQIGNEKPRIFRLVEDEAIINRLGFNNLGFEVCQKNLENIAVKKSYENDKISQNKIALGVNIGKNKNSEDALQDYLFLLEKFYQKASYITLNISSPNTKNLRDLQNENNLDNFLSEIVDKRNFLAQNFSQKTPIWLKIAPDLTLQEQEKIAEISLKNKIDGLIISNTTISRSQNLRNSFANQQGGLSGKPLFEMSNEVLKNFYKLTKKEIPLVGVGGISSAQDAYKKIKMGASLVQIYSALIYQGFYVVEKIVDDLSKLVEKDGLKNIKEAVGVEVY